MTQFKIPKQRRGKPIEGAIERALAKEETVEEEISPIVAPDRESMIYVPEAEAYFAKERSNLNLNWNDTHDALAEQRFRMPTIEEFRLYLKHLKSSTDAEFQEIYNEITEVRSPWRSEWLDAYFEERKDGLWILTGNKSNAEKLEPCLMEDRTPGIDLDSWISGKNTTSQGIPKYQTAGGSFYYWKPKDKRVAGFSAYSGRVDLVCSRGPSARNSSLGVYAVADADGLARGQRS